MKLRRLAALCLATCGLAAAAQEAGTPRELWLSNLRPIMSGTLCAQQSPFLRVYKEAYAQCPSTVDTLYLKCTTQVPQLVLPDMLTSEHQANL